MSVRKKYEYRVAIVYEDGYESHYNAPKKPAARGGRSELQWAKEWREQLREIGKRRKIKSEIFIEKREVPPWTRTSF